MQIEIFSHPKARDRSKPGDDVIVAIPGQVFAVLDGATDPSGAVYQGLPGGRFAAQAAATKLIEMTLLGAALLPVDQIADELSAAVAQAACAAGAAHPPSTTLAAAFPLNDGFRLILIGDSGIRINGTKILQAEKVIDRISTALRLCVRKELQNRIEELDALEIACRQVVTRGLDYACDNDLMASRAAERMIGEIRRGFPKVDIEVGADLVAFLRGGILTQSRFANRPEHPLGFASIIGSPPRGFGIIDEFVTADQCRSLEIYSDGYFDCPRGANVRDWERRFDEVELIDPEKTGPFISVKGSTASEFTDDRSIICLNRV